MPLEYEFYIDLFFLKDFFLNLLALLLAASMGRMKGKAKRLFIASAAGSAWSCAVLFLPGMPLWAELFLTVFLVGSFMTAFSFSLRRAKEILKADALLVVSVLLTGGFLMFLREYFWLSGPESVTVLAIVTAGGCFLFKGMLAEKERGRERILVWLYYRGKKREFLALVDSGNRLREPVSGKPVSVISFEDCKDFCDRISSVLYVPFRSVGVKEGVLPGIIFEKMEIYRGGRLFEIERPIVAVTKEPLSGNREFTMLLPEEFILHTPGRDGGLCIY